MLSPKTYARNTDGTYGPTARNHYYKPLPYHNRTASPRPRKNRWDIPENDQYEVFRISDEPWWHCNSNDCLFSIVDNGVLVLGQSNERLGKFRIPSNKPDPFHGYPVRCDEKQNRPGLDLLDRWEMENIISRHIRRKIERGTL